MDQANLIAVNEATVRRFFDGTHAGNLGVIDDTVAEDIVTHGFPGGADPYDRESYKQFFRDFGAAFSAMTYDMSAIVADAERVAVRFAIEVTHSGPFAGVPPTGRRVRFGGMVLYRLRDGLIAETWLHADVLSILAQIGALPSAEAA